MFTLAFWKSALEHALVVGLSTLAVSPVFTSGLTLKGLEAAGITAGLGALYAFIKQLGGVQAVSGVAKVGVKVPPVA